MSTVSNNRRSLVPETFAVTSRAMDDLIDRLFYPTSSGANSWPAPLSIWEENDHFYIEAELPGVAHDSLELTFEDGRLLLSAKRAQPSNEGRKYLYNERSYGEVKRAIAIPDSVDPESIEAEFSDGMLRVRFSKRPEVLPKKIEVKVKG